MGSDGTQRLKLEEEDKVSRCRAVAGATAQGDPFADRSSPSLYPRTVVISSLPQHELLHDLLTVNTMASELNPVVEAPVMPKVRKWVAVRGCANE